MGENNKYESKGYSYETNEASQIVHAEGDLRLEDGERNPYAQKIAGGEDRHIGDDGGHLIGTRFGGSGELDNIVAEDRYINRGAFKTLENEWADNLKKGNDVHVEINPVYHGESVRPDIITAKTEISNGDKTEIDYFSVTNENLSSEEFEIPKEADDMLELWDGNEGMEEDNNPKTLSLSNEDYRQPTNEELMMSGEEAIDRHMEILRDEMRNDGMEDGTEMETIISIKREESMTELRDGVYGYEDNASECNSFEEASTYDEDKSREFESSFEGASGLDFTIENDIGIDNSFTNDIEDNTGNAFELDGETTGDLGATESSEGEELSDGADYSRSE